MNPKFFLTSLILLTAGISHAWSNEEEAIEPPKTNEVTVVLEPPTDEAPTMADPSDEPDSTAPHEDSMPASADDEPLAETETPPAPDPEAEPHPTPRKGVSVRVEKLQTGEGEIDPADVKLNAPFPAKPLAKAPDGWRLETSDQIPPIVRQVELSPGRSITLKIRPHVLVPVADGTNSFSIAEPGFNPALGYRQNTTVGAILSSSIFQLEQDSIALGNTIEKLQQLLVTLPKTEEQPPQARPVEDVPSKPITPNKP